jgi:hypothetical protein
MRRAILKIKKGLVYLSLDLIYHLKWYFKNRFGKCPFKQLAYMNFFGLIIYDTHLDPQHFSVPVLAVKKKTRTG